MGTSGCTDGQDSTVDCFGVGHSKRSAPHGFDWLCVGHLGRDASDAGVGALAGAHARLVQALSHLGADGETSCSHPTSVCSVGAA